MIGLPHTYRFAVYNTCGIEIAIGAAKVYARRRKIDGTGTLLNEGAEATVFNNTNAIPQGSYSLGTAVSNDTDKWLSGDFVFEVVLTGAPNGDVFCYLERATDGGTSHWPTQLLGAVIAKLNFTTATTLRTDFSL
jgi:hypothetical protein